MGGQGSGRKPSEETIVRRMSPLQPSNYPSEDFIIPNLSGIKPEARKTSAETIWTSSNDGTGSGLDADMVDGKHNTDFIASDNANFATLTNDSMADALHRHSELSASDGTPNPALSVDAAGKVGIGTASPVAPFHLDATGTAYDATTGLAIFQDNADRQIAIGGLGLFRRDENGNADLRINYLGYNGGTTQFRDFNVYDGKSNSILFVDGSAGSVGIGTASPNGLLELSKNTAVGDNILRMTQQTTDTAGSNADIQFVANTVLWGGIRATQPSSNVTNMEFSNWNGSARTVRMGIYGTTGNVGIGTTSPQRQLQIGDAAVAAPINNIVIKSEANTANAHALVEGQGLYSITIGVAGTALYIYYTDSTGAARAVTLAGTLL